MRLDLHEIISAPGSVPFEYETDIAGMDFPGVLEPLSKLTANGKAVNSAGRLTLDGEAQVSLLCQCDRCGESFTLDKHVPISAVLSDELQDEDNPDIFPIESDSADLDDIILTMFVLSMETKLLCNPDCKGLCDKCGANLNNGSCSCGRGSDPRLAALAELLNSQE